MSDTQDFSAPIAENQDSMAVLPQESKATDAKIHAIEESLDGQTYFLGEVPQHFLTDPQAFLPLNSDKLIGSTNMVETLLSEVGLLIQEEVNQIQKAQKKINLWEDRIEKNKSLIQKNLAKVKQNITDIHYDIKNRDYWYSRADQVSVDYQHAEAGGREENWAWLIKKYGLKNPDSTPIDSKNNCVEELCNGAASNLSTEYKIPGSKYEQAKKDKEAENAQLIRENGRLLASNDQLQNYISAVYSNEIEPLQDGVLLYKELGVKVKAMGADGNQATYGQLRSWAESFLDEFLKANSRVPQHVVTQFRRLASIPLPARNS